MQVTTFTAYALHQVLKVCQDGVNASGYTTKPGSGMKGLMIYGHVKRGELVGYTD